MLVENGYCLSEEFKTANTFGHQPIIISNATLKQLLLSYIKNIRNKLIKGDKSSKSLWISFTGEELSERAVSQKITDYFMNKGLHITSTTIRKLVETEADDSMASE